LVIIPVKVVQVLSEIVTVLLTDGVGGNTVKQFVKSVSGQLFFAFKQ